MGQTTRRHEASLHRAGLGARAWTRGDSQLPPQPRPLLSSEPLPKPGPSGLLVAGCAQRQIRNQLSRPCGAHPHVGSVAGSPGPGASGTLELPLQHGL